MKRVFDILVSLCALLLLSPILLLAALAIVCESGLPIFFKQTRVGLHTQPFGIYKFRSMVQNAASTGPHATAANDPRITRVGRFIRKTSIDELPQLINVLLGHMSLVGPRPYVPVQEREYSAKDWAERHSILPGITGLAQATVRSQGTPEQSLALDLQYVRGHSLWWDVKIIAMTFLRITGKGGN
jgi:lipopolysaccharide/colanic/teichoic acid biosynthesis glycosyltransferase